MGLGLTLIGMVLVTMLARWISKPITQLVGEIRRIQDFDLEGQIELKAHITEVIQLIDALNLMKRALRTFGMFVPRDLVRDLVASGRPIELGGQDRTLTVMFTDIAGFTGLSEKMAAGDLMVHVSRHLAAISRCIGEEHGTVDKYIGDAVMAFWGAPVWRDDHALRGCVAALKARAAQDAINREWAASGLPTMFVRMGLHTAPVIVGNVGSEQRMSYTAVGDGVNVASRLEGVNKVYGTQICVSEAVVEGAGDAILVRPLDRVAVKGRKTGELVYELMALRRGDPELLATPDQLELCAKTAEAFAAYTARRWDAALALYQAMAERWPEDGLPKMYVERCHRFLADPPPEDWNGVYEMKVK
jgi:adenylate cyclase